MKRNWNNFGTIMVILLVIVNLLHLPWTVGLTIEQIQTGWDYATRLEMLVLLPITLEYLCTPVLLSEVVYFICASLKPPARKLLIANICLFAAVLLQYGLTHLFMWY